MNTNTLKKSWTEFRQSEPGSRFEDWYRRRRRQRDGPFDPSRIALAALGIVVVLGGIFLVPAPGPGWFIVFFGLGLLASQFHPMARFMDSAEVRGRRVARRLLGFWRGASLPVRAVLVAVGLAVTGAAGYAAYAIIFA